jgi:DNA-binding CsgD family transcriptional regulator
MTRTEKDFSGRDRLLLELTRPHIIQAYRAAEMRERLAATVGALRAGFDADRTAIVLLEGDGVVAFASAAATELLGRGGVALEEGGHLPQVLAAWVGEGEPSGRIEVGDASVLVRRLRSDGRTALILGEAGRALSLEALAELGLTPREAVVLHKLACGDEPEEVAAELGIAPRTVAKHMQRIHTKLGVTSRAQAMATAWAAVTYAPARTSFRHR